jgi:hypothetical protein
VGALENQGARASNSWKMAGRWEAMGR